IIKGLGFQFVTKLLDEVGCLLGALAIGIKVDEQLERFDCPVGIFLIEPHLGRFEKIAISAHIAALLGTCTIRIGIRKLLEMKPCSGIIAKVIVGVRRIVV